MFLRFSEYNDK